MNITEIYRRTTGFDPYPYQARLAERDRLPQVLNVPTGVGKTAAAILSWIYRRRFAADDIRQSTPRRLVYCLPMRTLVEQTRNAAVRWLERLKLHKADEDGIGVHLLMGGSDDGKWYEHPERNAILIGTQDMLLSRALNRGYGMSRYAWPVQYALLNNDSLWVLDETQLMGVGLTTSAQMQGFRRSLPTFGNCHTLWMSATLDDEALVTVDHPRPEGSGWSTESLDDDDDALVGHLLTAAKPCERAAIALGPNSKSQNDYARPLAEAIAEAHRPATLTLVVVNRVQRGQQLFSAIQTLCSKSDPAPEITLIHSRFRPADRRAAQEAALDEASIPEAGRIIVATQAIEAGVDLSATTMFTELAPWSSLVQRFGRCNRRGKCGKDGTPAARVVWIDVDTDNANQAVELSRPYSPDDLDRARAAIAALDDVGPQTLGRVQVDEQRPITHVLRRKDLLDLFDTTPDLSGNDLDVSRYIRDSEDSDVQVYWREWDRSEFKHGHPPPPQKRPGEIGFAAPQRAELCAVPVKQFRDYFAKLRKDDKTKRTAWVWDPLEAKWDECTPNLIQPGRVVLLHVVAGGYDATLGWTADLKDAPVTEIALTSPLELPEAMPQERNGICPLTVEEHLRDVGQAAVALSEVLDVEGGIPWAKVIQAAWWHDVGKAHPAFQGAMHFACKTLADDKLWAKSGMSGYLKYRVPNPDDPDRPIKRPGFRHELASALAWLQQHDGEPDVDLVAYLIGAHHGKVRLSIRSMPNETPPPAENVRDRLFARGLWQGDELPRIEIGNGDVSEAVTLDLSLMQLGEYENASGQPRPSWLSRTLALRDDEKYGPFRLAYLETLVRVADWRGSQAGADA
jgi:CRISPR-associated endonuclease/helicase Cas3